jgi:hypothetical protein
MLDQLKKALPLGALEDIGQSAGHHFGFGYLVAEF